MIVLYSAAIMFAIMIICAFVIYFTDKLTKKKGEDNKKYNEILELLPHANCGGCGSAGCEHFAKMLASGKGDINSCKLLKNEEKEKILEIIKK